MINAYKGFLFNSLPMSLIVVFYWKLFKHVKAHEKMLKDQAKRMNVQSLASNKDQAAQSVEIRIAKACFTIFFLFICAWTPYALVRKYFLFFCFD